jgi:hypothetical protein
MRARPVGGSPRLLGVASAACFGAPALGLACCVPSCLHLPGAGVPTQGTSHWGHPLGESNGNRPGGKNTTRIYDADCGLRSQGAGGLAGAASRGPALENGAAARPWQPPPPRASDFPLWFYIYIYILQILRAFLRQKTLSFTR